MLSRLVANTAAALLMGATAAHADGCSAPTAGWGPFPSLAESRTALLEEGALTVVAIGSSSTEGVGASGPSATYPAQLEQLLEQRFPKARIEVLNEGVGGETVADNLARFSEDVAAHRPDLVIWQVGTNDALRGVPAETIRAGLMDGIGRVRALEADLVLLDPQPLPTVRRDASIAAILPVLEEVAVAAQVPVLSRYTLMRHWLTSGAFTEATLLGADGLHMTDASYHCLAERIADLFPDPGPPAASMAAAGGD
ncbi:SGNH/GDSL hydrolase family protein [Geminicoccaceae bacterium 1502E]|nr:SGNH/GDSL hydrolase family protein [Geminicoccaceae bacterium 1502E]